MDKLEARSKVCLFIGYPQGMKGGLFYSPQDKKVIVNINSSFLAEDYMENHKPNSKVILEEPYGEIMNPQTSLFIFEQVEEQEHINEEIKPIQKQIVESRHRGKVTRLPAKYMLLGETFLAILAEHDQEPKNYEENQTEMSNYGIRP